MSIQLPQLISDGMVIQRGAPFRLWGRADGPVSIEFVGNKYEATPDSRGDWSFELPPRDAGGPYELRIGERMIRDVYVGDVWLLGGQSNMQLPMARVNHMYPDRFADENPMIRQFLVPQRSVFDAPQTDLDGGEWLGASKETIPTFSAAGYFFARRLFAEYGVPIGLILCAIGGTPVQAWMRHESLAGYPEFLAEADRCKDDRYVTAIDAAVARENDDFFGTIDANDPGLRGRWFAKGYDDGDWAERDLLDPWPGCGSVWLRKRVSIPDHIAGQPATLLLGTVVDADTVYIDGEPVGNTGYRYPPRNYAIPALPSGDCEITIRVISKDGGNFTPGKQHLLYTPEGAINLGGTWRFKRGATGTPPEEIQFVQNKPTGLYNGMLAPLFTHAIRGALWYQGESNRGDPARYAERCATMLADWRAQWGHEFPFLAVELAHWGEEDWRAIQKEQWRFLEIAPNTAMAAADDLGDHHDLHPQNKRDVGERLARLAMRLSYGEKIAPSPFEIVPLSR